jgi:putative pyruvate formate lyase activating enzyme
LQEHVVPQVIEAIHEAVARGFRLPIVYNTSSYDSMKSLELLDGLVGKYCYHDLIKLTT